MNREQARVRIGELCKQLTRLSYEYYVLDNPSVSDAIYDSLFAELKKLEAEYPDLITPDSPTQRIAAQPLSKFEKYTHKRRMISILDSFSDREASDWFNRIESYATKNLSERDRIELAKQIFWLDDKMDGLACALHYENGILVRAVTRGDGFVGEVVTSNVKTMPTVPLRLNDDPIFCHGETEVRGELIMMRAEFERINQELIKAGEKPFANPRNLAAGTIRQLDPRIAASRKIEFHAYDLLRDNAAEVPTNEFAYQKMRELGFKLNPEAHIEHGFNSAIEYAHKFRESVQPNLPFNTDGLVIKINDRKLYDDLGIVGKNPRGVLAYKYPAETAATKVQDIVLSLGRTGAVTPVAVFEPVQLAGTTIQHATLHNEDEIKRLDVRVGDTVEIFKAGEIIPKVNRVIMELRPAESKAFNFADELKRQYPDLKFERPEGEVVWRVCNAGGVQEILRRSIEHYASRQALDIAGLGTSNIAALINADLINDLADIYRLDRNKVVELEGFGDISADKLISAINASKQPKLSKFIYALGIRYVGVKTADDLATYFKTFDDFRRATYNQLINISGVGRVVAESIVAWWSNGDNAALVDKLSQLGVAPLDSTTSDKLSGVAVAITGTLNSMSREQAADRVRELGGSFQSSVGQSTTYLVAGGKVGASKLAAAEKYHIKIINEADFLSLINN